MQPLSGTILKTEFSTSGINLIEASAGTGKTYSIQTIFLRLVVTEGITVEKALVVTFTDAATKELRERLRSILEKCRLFIEGGKPLPDTDPDKIRIDGILKLQVKNIPEEYSAIDCEQIKIRRIKKALLDFDQAAIHTIHGFCQRSLQEFAFECGYDFDTDVVNSDIRLQELCNDWWRRIAYSNPDTVSEHILKVDLSKPEKLLNLVKAIAKRPMATVLPSIDDAVDNEGNNIKEIIDNIITYLKANGDTVKDDINNKDAEKYFDDNIILKISENIEILCSNNPPDYIQYFNIIVELDELMRPAGIPNYYEQPEEVTECITACKKCHDLISDKENNIVIKKDHCTMNMAVEAEWNKVFAEAGKIINKNYDILSTTLENDIKFYKKTNNNFYDTEKRNTYLITLKNQTFSATLKTALKQMALLTKANRLSWSKSKITDAFLKQTSTIIRAANILKIMAEAEGAKAVLIQYDKDKRNAHEMTYDDMLQRLRESLSGDDSVALQNALREKYTVALIDEFQDTDPVQYAIFNEIFAKGELPLFYVGDPKQAIYSFRGGDIFTYNTAVESIGSDNKYSLDKNYRSQKLLVDAVNTIFMDREEQGSIFGDKIKYSDKLKCNGLKNCFINNGVQDKQPFKIWKYVKIADKNPTGFSSNEAMAIYDNVAGEIVRLLNSKDTGFAEPIGGDGYKGDIRNVKPSDIAILVRRHAEAAFIYRALKKRRVPVVRQAGDIVFDSAEAIELLYLLKAMASPENISAVKTALASELLPVSDNEILVLAGGQKTEYSIAAELGIEQLPDSLDKWIILFKETKDLWLRKDFTTAFSRLAKKISINAKLASLPMGERRIVSVTQLHDLIQQNAIERHSGPESIIKWFARQIDSETREANDAFETRLESDADAVQIMTIFKSKGLEFPIVFVPTMWTKMVSGGQNPALIYHEEVSPNKTIIQLNKKDKDGIKLSSREKDEEDIRSFYVALTRASYRTYVVAGHLGSSKSILTTCMPEELLDKWSSSPGEVPISIIEKDFATNDDSFFGSDNKQRSIDLKIKGEVDVDRSCGHASFSSISPQGHIAPSATDLRDFDANDIEVIPDDAEIKQKLDIFSFPAGAHTGECWHSIFELLDFESDEQTIKEMVDKQLNLFGLDNGNDKIARAKKDIVFKMVRNVLQADIQVEDNKIIQLSDVTEKQKLAEMAFDFSLCSSGSDDTKNAVWQVLNKHWKNSEGDNKLFLDRLQNWETKIPGGFMTGFIDLLFEQDGRYYILDWKSNRLNCRPDGFDRNGLAAEISNHSYFLQYLIYTVAVHRYLGQCLGDSYDYDKYFGGVLYVFLRGVDQSVDKICQNGIYYTKPEKQLIEDLSAALTVSEKGGC